MALTYDLLPDLTENHSIWTRLCELTSCFMRLRCGVAIIIGKGSNSQGFLPCSAVAIEGGHFLFFWTERPAQSYILLSVVLSPLQHSPQRPHQRPPQRPAKPSSTFSSTSSSATSSTYSLFLNTILHLRRKTANSTSLDTIKTVNSMKNPSIRQNCQLDKTRPSTHQNCQLKKPDNSSKLKTCQNPVNLWRRVSSSKPEVTKCPIRNVHPVTRHDNSSKSSPHPKKHHLVQIINSSKPVPCQKPPTRNDHIHIKTINSSKHYIVESVSSSTHQLVESAHKKPSPRQKTSTRQKHQLVEKPSPR